MPDSIMPAFRFTDDEFSAMAASLEGQKAIPAMATPAESYKALCQRCHGEKGDGLGPIAQHLDPSPRDFTKAGFMNSKSLTRLTDSIRHGVAGTSMPAWGKLLDEPRSKALLDHIQASFVRSRARPPWSARPRTRTPCPWARNPWRAAPPSSPSAAPAATARRATQGAQLLDILPKPRNLRNAWFVNSVADRRLFESILYGVQGTAMPSWSTTGSATTTWAT